MKVRNKERERLIKRIFAFLTAYYCEYQIEPQSFWVGFFKGRDVIFHDIDDVTLFNVKTIQTAPWTVIQAIKCDAALLYYYEINKQQKELKENAQNDVTAWGLS